MQHTYKYNHWITDTEKPTTAKAFTYTIWFPELGQRYIGYKTINKSNSWLTYKSSSRPVNKLISECHTAVYRIIKWFDNATDARVEEIDVMTSYDVTNRSEYLNQCIGGVKFSYAGKTHTAETRAKISAASNGRKLPPITAETRAKMSAAKQNMSAETRSKIGAASKGRTHTVETRAKMSAASKDRQPISDETRAKISASKQIGLYVTPLGTFKTTKEASVANSCALETIRDRCKSTSPKFNDWAFFRNP
ncbi:NUMOD3 domain-containing DNA-binding protein [Shewanella sp.]|uniref:NUMOD3 domain-containing DNA-binding protein n=1 Tax=Shewanella sp. TaxID=50422 RepID=UPI004048C886